MTDRQSETDTESETMNHEDIYATPEGGEGDPWQGDLPPADDFHDDAGEAAPYGEEAEAAPSSAVSADEEAKKRGRMVLLSVFGVIALFGAGLAYLNLSSSDEGGPVTVPMAVSLGADAKKTMTGTYPEDKPANNEADMLSPRTAETDLSALYAKTGASGNGVAGGTSVALPGGTDLGGKTAEADKTAMAAAVKEIPSPANGAPQKAQELAPASVQAPAPVVATPAATPASEMNLFAPTTQAAPAPSDLAAIPAMKEAPASASAATESRIQELSTEVATLKKALDESLRHTQDLTQRLEVSSASERQVRQELEVAKAQKASSKPVEAPAAIMVHDTQASSDMYAEPVAPKKKAVVAKKAKKTVAAKEKKASRHAWILRAATPDAAWVSKGADATDLERIHVGDSVEGIGVVKAIRQKGEAWEVVGSKGKIQ